MKKVKSTWLSHLQNAYLNKKNNTFTGALRHEFKNGRICYKVVMLTFTACSIFHQLMWFISKIEPGIDFELSIKRKEEIKLPHTVTVLKNHSQIGKSTSWHQR